VFIGVIIIFCALQSTLVFATHEAIDFATTELSIAEKNYNALEEALPMYEQAIITPWPTIPTHVRLKPGMKNISVMALRGRLKATKDLLPEDDTGRTLYDHALTLAVKHFQIRHGLNPDGIVGPETLYELNISPEERLHQIKVNMERWSKLSNELGDRFIMVNVPDYQLDLIENGQRVLSMKAIVGKPDRPTPEIFSTITRVVFNPYWNVPKMIANEDIIPKILKNRNYLDDMHIRILDRQVDDAYEINPDEVDWKSASEEGFQYHFRQDPGNNNALGLIKFEFNNANDIYLHDTPARNLFNQTHRAFSSGCIRLEKPYDLAYYLMRNDPNWNEEKLESYLGAGTTKYVKVSNPTRVIITYLTSWVDDNGNVQFRDDVYGWDNNVY
jgi:murein L,D-transpeptidase YcbB/YkuD